MLGCVPSLVLGGQYTSELARGRRAFTHQGTQMVVVVSIGRTPMPSSSKQWAGGDGARTDVGIHVAER